MRFQVSQVLDSIERRLTTDITLAQAVVDLGEVARFTELDRGRPVNLLRIGMAVDALSRYLLDAGAMLYGIVGRQMLSESALTSKERMVLGRWLDEGLIEVVPEVTDRAVEVADLTGLPLVAVRGYDEYADAFGWLPDNPERLLRLRPRAGSAVLAPADGVEIDPDAARAVAVGKAPVATDKGDDGDTGASRDTHLIKFPEIFATHGAQRTSHTMVMRRRLTRAEPSGLGASLTARQWRCVEPDCPAFGERRTVGQPVPRMLGGVPCCPRHATPVRDVGARPAAYAMSVVVDDLARRRFVVREGQPVPVGIGNPDGEDAGGGTPEGDDAHVISVAEWAHQGAASWIGPVHVRLELRDGELIVTDVSKTGTAIWQRSGPDDIGHTTWLYGSSYTLREWDSVELYTGIELVPGDRRLATVVGRAEPLSVLVDAPTAALRQLS